MTDSCNDLSETEAVNHYHSSIMTSPILSTCFLSGQRERIGQIDEKKYDFINWGNVPWNSSGSPGFDMKGYEKYLKLNAKAASGSCCLSGTCLPLHSAGGQTDTNIFREQSSFIQPINMVWLEAAQKCLAHWSLFPDAVTLLGTQILNTHLSSSPQHYFIFWNSTRWSSRNVNGLLMGWLQPHVFYVISLQ